MLFLGEIKRRKVLQIAAIYAVTAWLLIQIAATVESPLRLPDWVDTLVIVLLALGFPVALVLAWAYELTPEGLKREKTADRSESGTQQIGRKIDYAVIAVLVLALGFFAIDKLLTNQSQGPAPERPAAANSIAVLPFLNMSPEPEQEYFSEGISEELLNVLTKIPNLRVSARTSSFSFKGKQVDIPTIASKLQVSHVLEGSVRQSGDELRITVQLVKDDGYHLWSQTYDRTMDDLFAIQSEIATSVAEALKITLFDDPPLMQETSPDVYKYYLRARYFDNRKGKENWEKAISNYRAALAVDPDYAPAWAGLSVTYRYQANVLLRDFDEGMDLARDAAQKALALDESLAVAWSNLGQIEILHAWDWDAAERAIQKALQLEPSNAEVLNHAATLQHVMGNVDEAIALLQRSLALDPLSQSSHNALGLMYMYSGRLIEAEKVFRQLLELNPQYPWGLKNLARLLLLQGEPGAALDNFEKSSEDAWRASGIVMALSDLGRYDEAGTALVALEKKYPKGFSHQIAAAYAWRGNIDRAFDWLQRSYRTRESGLIFVPSDPFFSNLHDDPRWPVFVENLGLPHGKSEI